MKYATATLFCNRAVVRLLTKEGTPEKWSDPHSDNGRRKVDEPIRKEWCDSQEHDVPQHILVVSCYLHKDAEQWTCFMYRAFCKMRTLITCIPIIKSRVNQISKT